MVATTTATMELLEKARDAQLAFLREYLADTGEYSTINHSKWSTDGYDYMRAALNLSSALVEAYFDEDLETFQAMLDPSNEAYILYNYACDGVCGAVYEMLPQDEDGDAIYEERV